MLFSSGWNTDFMKFLFHWAQKQLPAPIAPQDLFTLVSFYTPVKFADDTTPLTLLLWIPLSVGVLQKSFQLKRHKAF